MNHSHIWVFFHVGETPLVCWQAVGDDQRQCEWSVPHLFSGLRILASIDEEVEEGCKFEDLTWSEKMRRARRWVKQSYHTYFLVLLDFDIFGPDSIIGVLILFWCYLEYNLNITIFFIRHSPLINLISVWNEHCCCVVMNHYIWGLWKKSCKASWNKTHGLLWPGVDPPDLLLPMAVSKRKREEQQEQNNSYFTESTLPTSMLFSALCSQITQHRLRTRSRYAACRLLYDILKKLTGTGKMKVAFTAEGRLYNIATPRSGLVNSSIMGSFMDDAVSLSDVKRSWRKDAQDSFFQNVIHNKYLFKFIHYDRHN